MLGFPSSSKRGSRNPTAIRPYYGSVEYENIPPKKILRVPRPQCTQGLLFCYMGPWPPAWAHGTCGWIAYGSLIHGWRQALTLSLSNIVMSLCTVHGARLCTVGPHMMELRKPDSRSQISSVQSSGQIITRGHFQSSSQLGIRCQGGAQRAQRARSLARNAERATQQHPHAHGPRPHHATLSHFKWHVLLPQPRLAAMCKCALRLACARCATARSTRGGRRAVRGGSVGVRGSGD